MNISSYFIAQNGHVKVITRRKKMENLLTLVDSANSVLWNVILIVLLCGTGIYYTIRLKFIQIRKFPEGLKHVFGNLNLNGEKGNNGEMTPFQSVATAICSSSRYR